MTDGHKKMVAILDGIRKEAAETNPYFGEASLRYFESLLAKIPSGASGDVRCRLYAKLAVASQNLGREQDAIDYFSKCYELFPTIEKALPSEVIDELIFRLALSHMRLGETQNCAMHNNPDSCILPIRGAGIHTRKEGSERAAQYFLEVLGRTPPDSAMHLRARWLLNIAHMTLGTYPKSVPKAHLIPQQALESDEPFPRFINIARRLGVDTFSNAGGAIGDDFDNDGYLDLMISTWDPALPIRFFRNNQDGTFSERTKEANLDGILGGLNLVQADYNNDGNVDVLALRGGWWGKAGQHPKSLLRNNGDGTFTDVTFEAGLGEVNYPTQTANWADYDNDGDLDLFVGNESWEGLAAPCQLFKNNGDGTFKDVAAQAGVTNDAFAKGVAWGDYNGDRLPDLYISNHHGPDRLYQNQGNGTFIDVASKLGVTGPTKSFPVWFWDFDNDGVLDLFVAAYAAGIEHVAASYLGLPFQTELARLYRGDGRGGFEDAARERNLIRPNFPMGSNFGDLDNDGYLDFYLGTGDPHYWSLAPNLMYRNRAGKSFADVTWNGGFGNLQKGHAVVFADFDNDGDQDIFEKMGGAYPGDRFNDVFFENPGFGNHWITVKLVGVQSNRSAIGARIRLEVTEHRQKRSIYKHANSGGSFGANPLRQTIGLGEATKIDLLEVFWPTTGQAQTFRDVPVDQQIQLVEGADQYTKLALKKVQLGRPVAGQ